jgi:hypothetical protein
VQLCPLNFKSGGRQKAGTRTQVTADFNHNRPMRLSAPKLIEHEPFISGQVGMDLPCFARVGPTEAGKRGEKEETAKQIVRREMQFLIGSS